MSLEPRQLRVVAVSQDLSALHEISWILEAVGYKVETAGELAPDALWRRYATADFVIVDGRHITEPTCDTFACDSDNPVYRIFLYVPAGQTDFSAWYAAGAHDALRAPVSRGELLARLRTGARYLEFERRLQDRSSRSAVPGMYSRRGLLRKLRKLAGDDVGSMQHTLLATSIDWYAGIRRKSGESAARNLVNTAARAIKRAVVENGIPAYFGDGRFVTLIVGPSAASAKGVAESLAKDFGSRESHHESIPRPTLTSAVVPGTAGSDADQLLSEALETLALAEQSGGDCVVMHGEFNKEFTAWKDEMATGNPFATVVAQDIMEPFPALLERSTGSAIASDLAEALRLAGVPVRPYVDRDGRLVGVATEGDERAAAPLATPETIACDASFPEIYEAFSSRGCSTLVVTTDNRPLGYITCDGFLSMIDPLDTESFAGTGKSADELAYLVVPSVIGTAVEPAGV